MNIISGKIQTAKKVVIYGPEGIGKSTFASQFPDPIFCDTEGSTKALEVKRFERPQSADELYECIDYVMSDTGSCSTFVLDTADWAEKLLAKKVCSLRKKEGIEDFGYGKGYTYLAEEFGKLLNRLEDLVELGINVVVTAHAQLQKFEQPDENGSYDRWSLKLTKMCSPMLKEWADAVLFVNYKTYVEKTENNKFKASGGKRVMYTSHHPCWDAKNRWEMPDECGFDYSVIAPFIPSGTAKADSRASETVYSRKAAEIDRIVDDEQPPQPAPSVKLDGIPEALAELMTANNVAEEDIRLAVSQEGYYPFETRVKDYDPEFIEGCLISAWPELYRKILSNQDLPFGGE